MATLPTTWLDRATSQIAPIWTLKRQRARVAAQMLARHYEAASTGRRTQGWNRTSTDANAAIGPALTRLRDTARDLVRNNAFAESALSIIVDHMVGYGITPRAMPKNTTFDAAWKQWGETTACDADGRHDFYGLEKLVARTVAESGEALVRRRFRKVDANGTVEGDLPLPLQLQVLDPDFLDTSKDNGSFGRPPVGSGNIIIQGIEFDVIGRRVAYWLFPEHPGSNSGSFGQSVRVPASSVLHVFRALRPGQVRGPSWFAPVLTRFKDFDELADAQLMKQKIAACLALVTTDVDGQAPALGLADDESTNPGIDALEPGAILTIPPGRSVEVVEPPSVREYSEYSKTIQRELASGLGITYEDLTGDYSEMNFSSSRASHIKHWQRVDDWRWRMLIPQFCDPAFAWFVQSATISGQVRGEIARARWSPPPTPMVDPVNEGLAYQRNIRSGFTSLPEVLRELGYDPDEVFDEIAETNKKLDRLEIVLDSDPRRMTQAGQAQAPMTPAAAPADAEQSRATLLHAVNRR